MGWLITLGILFLLAILPLGVSIKYNSEGPVIRLILGPVKITLVPGKKKEKKEKKKPEKKPKKQKKTPEKTKQLGKDKPEPQPKPEEQKEKGGSILDFLPLVNTVFEFLGDFRRKLRLNHLELKLIMAGDDPCDLAVNYGRAWAAVGNLMPRLERWFVIKNRDVEVECDFFASETLIIARLDLTITLGRVIAALVRFAYRALREYLKIKKKRKGGANQ